MEKDPVCGMMVEPATAAASYEYEGKTYHFCAISCKVAFEKDPEKYLGRGRTAHSHQAHHQATNGALCRGLSMVRCPVSGSWLGQERTRDSRTAILPRRPTCLASADSDGGRKDDMSRKTKTSQSAMSRKELMRASREARRRRSRIRAIALVSGVVVVIALLVSWSVINASNRLGEPVPDMGKMHIEEGTKLPVAYNFTPPTSSPHYGSLARWGIHTEPIPDELMVHNLEDGGVGIWYDCPDGCSELVSQLESVAERYHEGVLLAPYPGMDSRIALTAWDRVDRFDEFDEERLVRFIWAFRGADHHVQ